MELREANLSVSKKSKCSDFGQFLRVFGLRSWDANRDGTCWERQDKDQLDEMRIP